MITIDWEKFTGIEPEALSLQDKENLYETVVWFQPDTSLSKKYLIHFVRVTQEVLKFKNEQLDSLTNELDEMATRQGAEESNKLQEFRNELEQLQEELDWYRKLDKTQGVASSTSDEDLRQKLIKMKNENEELLGELSEKEKDLVFEKKEVERYASLLATVEREKEELTRELKTLQEEGTEKSFRSVKNSPESDEKNSEMLTEIIKQKNKHISQLLEDVEAIEEENWTLRNKISAIKDELAETTTSIREVTEELAKYKHLNKELEMREIDSKEKINSLMCQIEELVEEKEKHDKQLDEYVSAFNGKVEEWKEVLEAKDDEILRLKEEIKSLCSSENAFGDGPDAAVDTNLGKRVMQQNEQIHILEQELQKATDEINASTELIEKLKDKQMKAISLSDPDRSAIDIFQEKIRVLEEKLAYAENDAQLKAEESSKLIVQLREYESKVFGLTEAVEKINKLEKIIWKKDLQAEKLVDVCNDFELRINGLEEENFVLRERLGLEASDEIDTSGLLLKMNKNKEKVTVLEKELNLKEEELIKAKLTCRQIIAHYENLLSAPPGPPGEDHPPEPESPKPGREDADENSSRLKMSFILKENDALRKGMHEILESIREQNSLGEVQVQSTCLERLLEALDSRHISGWYHPAMRLQAQLSTEEGKNDELRTQIRFLKAEERKKASELQNAYLKIQTLENDMSSSPRTGENKPEKEEDSRPLEPPGPVPLDNFPINAAQEKRIIQMESELRKLKVLFESKTAEADGKERSFAADKEELLSRLEALQAELDFYKTKEPDRRDVAESGGQIVLLNRKVRYLKALEAETRENLDKSRREYLEDEGKTLLDILKLQNDKIELVDEIERLQNELANTVSAERFESVKRELSSMTNKYKSAMGLSLATESAADDGADLRAEISLLEAEKRELSDQLKSTREKLVIAEALIKEETVTKGDFSNEISLLARNLAASEARELTEKQKTDHLEKMNDAFKLQINNLELRNKELLERVIKLTEENLKCQEAERELRNRGWKLLRDEERAGLESTIESLEKKLRDSTKDRENVEELLEISQRQCRAFQEWKNEDRILIEIQREEILHLQAGTDDKANISRLSHELATAKLKSSELAKKNENLTVRMTKLMEKILVLEGQVSKNRHGVLTLKKKHLAQVGFLTEEMEQVRNLYASNLAFRDLEDVHKKKADMKKRRKTMEEEVRNLKAQSHEYLLKKGEMETQLESLQDLKAALKGDAKNLVSWHNKTTALRLKEARWRRQNEFLSEEVSQLRSSLDRLNEEMAVLEEESLERERTWEEKRRMWEESQHYVCQLLRESGLDSASRQLARKPVCDAATETPHFLLEELRVEEVEEEGKKREKESKTIENEEEDLLCRDGAERVQGPGEDNCLEKVQQEEEEVLRMTIGSLENIIKGKEETILRYEELLKAEREEYRKSYSKLELEVQALNERLVVQGRAYGKLKEASRSNRLNADSVSTVVEKYITRIQELEEELRDCQLTLSSINTQAHFNQEEVDKWKTLAAERLLHSEEAKRRMEADHKMELDNYRKEIKNYQTEIERLGKVSELQAKDSGRKQTGDSIEEVTSDRPLGLGLHRAASSERLRKSKEEQSHREMEALKKQLKSARSESSRLREQIRVLESRPQRRPKTAGSITARSEGCLTSKIKNLEELLTTSRERERELMDLTEKKLKSAEEVARWNERKKNEQLVKNLSQKLKEKEGEVEMLTSKNESFRNMVYKSERDKGVLESQIKALRGNATSLNSRLDKLETEKKEAEERARELEKRLEEQKRHSSGVGAALLHEKLEAQERKLIAFELASRGQSCLVEDMEKLRAVNSSLEKQNLKLESENLSLRFQLEKETLSWESVNKKVLDRQGRSSVCSRRDRATPEENGGSHKRPKGPCCDCAKLRSEYHRIKEENEIVKGKYLDLMKEKAALEESLKSYEYQIHLMEEKDFAQVISSINFRDASHLSLEVEELKRQLAHKNQLLSRVKVLLVKAAAKERASREFGPREISD